MIYGGNMVKEIEIYNGKTIQVDFTKVERIICNIFVLFLFCIFILMPNFNKIIGLEFRNFLFILVSFVTMIVLIGTKVLASNIKINKYYIILCLYFICILFSYMFSSYRSEALLGTDGRGEGLISLLSYMFSFYITFNGFKYNKKIFNYITCAVVILAGYGAVQSLLSDNYTCFGSRPYMGQSNFGNPNTFSGFLMLILPIYLVKFYNSKEKIYLCILSVVFAGIIGSKTFAGWLTAFFVFSILSIYFIIILKNKKQIIFSILKVITIFIVAFIIFNISNDNAYIKEFYDNKTEVELITTDKSDTNNHKFGNNRGYIWKISLNIICEHPWFGVGPDSFGSEVRLNYMNKKNYVFNETRIDKAHSEYLQIGATTGTPSLIIYIVFLLTVLISMLIKYIEYVKRGQVLEDKTMILVAVTGSIVAYMIQAAANISIFAVTPLFWAMLGIGAKIASESE